MGRGGLWISEHCCGDDEQSWSQKIQEMTEAGAEDWEIEAAVRDLIRRGPGADVSARGLRPDLESGEMRASVGFGVREAFFRPELLNRIDEVVVFHQLGRGQLDRIVEIQVERLRERLAERGMSLVLSDSAKKALAEEGFDPAFGARPLKRVIQQRIENALASRLLAGEFGDGDEIVVGYEGKSFVFGKGGGGGK